MSAKHSKIHTICPPKHFAPSLVKVTSVCKDDKYGNSQPLYAKYGLQRKLDCTLLWYINLCSLVREKEGGKCFMDAAGRGKLSLFHPSKSTANICQVAGSEFRSWNNLSYKQLSDLNHSVKSRVPRELIQTNELKETELRADFWTASISIKNEYLSSTKASYCSHAVNQRSSLRA